MKELISERPRATLNEVATRAGVSRATAGRVLSGSQRVSPDRTRAVRIAADELGYITNRAARALVTGRTDAIAMVITENSDRVFADPFFAELVRGARQGTEEAEVQLLLVVLSSESDRTGFLRFALGGTLDAVILASLHGADPLPEQLRNAGVSVVVAGRPYAENVDLPRVDADNVAGGRLAARALLAAGATHPATINGPLDLPAARDRLRGWVLEMTAAGRLPGPAMTADFTQASGYRVTQQLLRRRRTVDGLFCANDQIAIGALRAIIESGRKCPEDIKIIGFDDSPPAAASHPSLTSVRQPIEDLGRELAHMAISLSRQEPTLTKRILPTSVTYRKSC